MRSMLETGPTAEEVESWPTWNVTDTRALARYVDGRHVEGMDVVPHELHHQLSDELGSNGPDCYASANRRIVEQLLLRVAGKDIRYRTAEIHPDGTQRLCHAQQLRLVAGSCVDLSVAVASACDRSGLAPLICVGWNELNPVGHAWVVIDLWRSPSSRERDDGDLHAYTNDELAGELLGPRYLPIDVSQLQVNYEGQQTDAHDRVSRALSRGPELLRATQQQLDVVDVKVTHAQLRAESGDNALLYELPPPTDRPEIIEHLPGGPPFQDVGPGRAAILAQLTAGTGSMIVHGTSGAGKSMLALEAARGADGGYGWMCNASDSSTLIDELAGIEARRVGIRRDAGNLIAADREALASEALARLHTTDRPWVVVIDNANGDPAELRRWLPRPRADLGQLLLITTTNRAWIPTPDRDGGGHQGAVGVEVPPIAELERFPDQLGVNGLPLFSEAYKRLSSALDVSLTELGVRAASSDHGGDAAALLWAFTREYLTDRAPGAVQLATTAAWSSVDHLDAIRLAELAGTDPSAWTLLNGCGLVSPAGPTRYRMHRLIAAAVRTMQHRQSPAATLDAIEQVISDEDMSGIESLREQAIFLQHGKSWPDNADPARRGGLLHDVAEQLEPRIGPPHVTDYLQTAVKLLAPDDHRRRAGCLHALARIPYQPASASMTDLLFALEQVEESSRHRSAAVDRASEADRVQRQLEQQATLAFEGLVRLKMVQVRLREQTLSATDRAEQVMLAGEASRIIEDSYEQRLALSGGNEREPLVVRGRFNLAPSAITLAQLPDASAEQRRAFLDRAESAYVDVRAIRESMASTPTAHIAACIHGLGIVTYLRALLLPPEELRTEKTRHLRDWEVRADTLRAAAAHTIEGLELRERVAPTDGDGDDIPKSATLETKIALARLVWRSRKQLADRNVELAHVGLSRLRNELDDELRKLLSWLPEG